MRCERSAASGTTLGVILDSSILIAAERSKLDLESLLKSLGDRRVAIAAVTAAELLHGCHRASDAAIRIRRFAFVEALLEVLPVKRFGLAEARLHAELWAALVRAGQQVGAHALLIGATALAAGDGLATLNVRNFARIPGLDLVPVALFER